MTGDEAIKSFDAICTGAANELPESAFMYVGGIASVREKAAKLQAK